MGYHSRNGSHTCWYQKQLRCIQVCNPESRDQYLIEYSKPVKANPESSRSDTNLEEGHT